MTKARKQTPVSEAKHPSDRQWSCQWVSPGGERCRNPAAGGSLLCTEHAPKGSSWLSPGWQAVKRAYQRATGKGPDAGER